MESIQKNLSLLILCTILGMALLSACSTTAPVDATSNAVSLETELSENVVIEDTLDSEEEVVEVDDDEAIDAAHSKKADPDYEIVFPQAEVNEITITISEENWAAMMSNLEDIYGGRNTSSDNPIWVTATIDFEGETWENVGMRFKGNSSLRDSWSKSSIKLPFKLDFDEFEDDYPEIEDQRFYGFKQLSFSSNYKDSSYLREKVTAELFQDAGVPSAETAFYAVYLDNGSEVEYMGLYTAVEVVDDTVIETQFDDDSGNVYKPDGRCATFAAGTYDESCYDKETNQEEADYSDLTALLDALHSDLRVTDPAAWREGLENVFNVDGFIDYLAVNTVVQNWDTYGVMTHNYYLYTDPDTGLVNWIPWDNNEALQDSAGGMTNTNGNKPGGRGGNGRSAPSISLDEINQNWPLIRYLMDDEVYAQQYAVAVEEVITEVFTVEKMTAIYEYYASLIEEYVLEEGGNQGVAQFDNAIAQLKTHVAMRVSLAQEYLASVK